VPTNRTVQRPEGTYHLTWSTPTSSTVSDQDVEVVGTWNFEAGHIIAENNTTSSNDIVANGRKATRNVVIDKNDVKSGDKGEVLPNTSSQNSNFLPIIGISILWTSAGLWYKKGKREDEL
ncbi:TPA: LPXTG cell wall anchor domain-containing protein, partial [Streptococcus suis]